MKAEKFMKAFNFHHLPNVVITVYVQEVADKRKKYDCHTDNVNCKKRGGGVTAAIKLST